MKRRCIAAFSNICKLLRSPLIRLAVHSTPSSIWEKAFIVVRFSRNLASLHNSCHPPRLFSAPNHRTRGSGQRSWTQGVRSTTEGESKKRTEESLLSSGRFRLSPATGGGAAVPPSIFIQAAFTSHTGSLLLSSPKKVTSPFVPLRPPSFPSSPRLPPLRHKKSETPIATQHRNKSLAISSRSGPCGRALTAFCRGKAASYSLLQSGG